MNFSSHVFKAGVDYQVALVQLLLPHVQVVNGPLTIIVSILILPMSTQEESLIF
jgi:hypothetical protein